MLDPGVDNANYFTSVCINVAVYLPWLLSQCRTAGVVFKRTIASHVVDAANNHHSGKAADLVVNCTGLSSLTLGGVEDKTLHPVRGQLVVVRNDSGFMQIICGTDYGDGEGKYTMTHDAACR